MKNLAQSSGAKRQCHTRASIRRRNQLHHYYTMAPTQAPPSDADPAAVDFETIERRYTLAVTLESWELLAMHSIAGDEVGPPLCLLHVQGNSTVLMRGG